MTDQEFLNKMHYFNGVRDTLDYDTAWSIYEVDHIDTEMLSEKARRVFYRFYDDAMNEIEVSSLAVNGTVRELWRAAESCYQQAKAQGDWHYFIEDFQMQDDGSLEIWMGS